jgi:hypothetical protein
MPALPTLPLPLPRRPSDSRRRGRLLLFLIVLVSAAAALAYLSCPSSALTPPRPAVRADADCCRGTQGLELWGPAVKWGSNHRLPSAAACCASCKAMCPHAEDGACRCNSWVFCGDERRCKDRLGEVSPSVSVPLLLSSTRLSSVKRCLDLFVFPVVHPKIIDRVVLTLFTY